MPLGMAQYYPSNELGGESYGFTCSKCPERGSRAIVGDLVSYPTMKNPKGRETLFIGFPDRCKECNARHQMYKRAREAIERLYFVKPANDGWEYLKFVTITKKMELVDEEEPTEKMIRDFKKWYVKGRDKIREELKLWAGTDVLEIVTTEKEGKYHHHMHIHGIWVMPYFPIDTIRKAFDKVGFGRDQVRAIKESSHENKFGKEYTRSAIQNCIGYLAKYITKAQGSRRMMWGEVRRWKEYMHSEAPRHRIKNMFQYEKWRADLEISRTA
jgi:hypothetical protein